MISKHLFKRENPTDFLWCPRQESNLYPKLRRLVFYPLNYEDHVVPGVGLEPTRTYVRDILSVVCMPFHHPGL